MTTHRTLRWAAWAIAALIVLASMRAWATVVPSVRTPAPPMLPSPGSPPAIDTTALDAAAAALRDRNPFRVARRPADVRFSPWEPRTQHSEPTAPTPRRPTLALVGILGGPPWIALVEGIPGQESGVLLSVGQEANGIVLREIQGDTAVLVGLDSTWVLTPYRPWQ